MENNNTSNPHEAGSFIIFIDEFENTQKRKSIFLKLILKSTVYGAITVKVPKQTLHCLLSN